MNKKFFYLTKLSLNKKIKSKWFLITNIILLIAIVCLFNISSIIKFFGGDFANDTKILVIDNTNLAYEYFKANIEIINEDENITTEKISGDLEEITKDINDKEIIIVINNDIEKFIKAEIISEDKIDNLTYQIVLQALNSTKTTIGMISSNIEPTVLQNISSNIEVERTILNDSTSTDENMDLIMSSAFPTLILPFFMLIIFLVQMVGGEICEEKTTRSMEIIISNVSPKQHLLSKVLASNLFVIIQGLLLILYVGIAFYISHLLNTSLVDIPIDFNSLINVLKETGIINKLVYIIPLTIILIILSFMAYSIVAGILASMTVNIEDFNQLQSPIMLISIAGYYLAIMAAMFDGSIFIRIISYIPFLSVFISPTLFLLGQITIFDMLISIGILGIFVYTMLKFGLKVYKVGILNYSSGKIWNKFLKAIKGNN